MLSRRRPDLASLGAGLALVVAGVVLLLHELGELELTFASATPIGCAVVGVILLSVGLARGRDR